MTCSQTRSCFWRSITAFSLYLPHPPNPWMWFCMIVQRRHKSFFLMSSFISSRMSISPGLPLFISFDLAIKPFFLGIFEPDRTKGNGNRGCEKCSRWYFSWPDHSIIHQKATLVQILTLTKYFSWCYANFFLSLLELNIPFANLLKQKQRQRNALCKNSVCYVMLSLCSFPTKAIYSFIE